jgi:hypothetical protein
MILRASKRPESSSGWPGLSDACLSRLLSERFDPVQFAARGDRGADRDERGLVAVISLVLIATLSITAYVAAHAVVSWLVLGMPMAVSATFWRNQREGVTGRTVSELPLLPDRLADWVSRLLGSSCRTFAVRRVGHGHADDGIYPAGLGGTQFY